VAEGFEPYSATLQPSPITLLPAKTHLCHSLQISVTVLKMCSKCAHDCPFEGFAGGMEYRFRVFDGGLTRQPTAASCRCREAAAASTIRCAVL
jgi:hypothetical protein